MDTKQIDLTKLSEVELLKFIIEQQDQRDQLAAMLYQVAMNIQNAKGLLPKGE